MNHLKENSALENDPVRPGEQWFLYWKTSAALWESRLQEFAPHEIIFIPLYWGFHAEGNEDWDFGRLHPERDLLRLARLLTQHGRKFCWLLPLTPAPFLPNGGIPVHCARTLMMTPDGLHLGIIDQEEKLNKMYSFFEPKVVSSFGHFVTALGKFLSDHAVKAPLWGVDFCYREGDTMVSYMEDHSQVFEQGFSRYLRKNFPNGSELQDFSEELRLKVKFTSELKDLFLVTAESALGPYWMGTKSIVMLGGSPRESFERALTNGKSQQRYFQDLLEIYTRGEWMSSALLTAVEKAQLLPFFLREHFGAREIEENYHYHVQRQGLGPELRPFALVDIFSSDEVSFTQNGLLPYLKRDLRWMYQIHRELDFKTEWIEANHHKIKFFEGRSLDRTRFGQMLKLFMMGQRVILDRSGLSPDLEKRLHIFFLENNLKLQSVNFLTALVITDIGDGKLITFEGEKLQHQEKAPEFWDQVFRYLNIVQPGLSSDEEVYSLWRIRATLPEDLNYIDVRRVNLYNPTSYKKKISINTRKQFAFMRSIDPLKADARTTPDGVEVELLPFGKIALDFGHYEENR